MAEQGPNIAATIFHDLRGAILRGDLKAGERLPGERELAQKYDTNRNTLREAVRKLEQARLVTVRHGQGVTVSDFRRTGTMELLPPLLEAGASPVEVAHLLEDILPARLMVIEFAARLATRRGDKGDLERLQDITDLLISAFDGGDPIVIGRGFQRWLETVIDAGHSVSVRWIANPFLEAYREILERFPSLWVLDPTFPTHLREFLTAVKAGDEDGAVLALRRYYAKIDGAFMAVLGAALQASSPSPPVATTPERAQKSGASHERPLKSSPSLRKPKKSD